MHQHILQIAESPPKDREDQKAAPAKRAMFIPAIRFVTDEQVGVFPNDNFRGRFALCSQRVCRVARAACGLVEMKNFAQIGARRTFVSVGGHYFTHMLPPFMAYFR